MIDLLKLLKVTGEQPIVKTQYDVKLKKKVQDMRRAGMTYKQIQVEHNISKGTLSTWLAGIKKEA